MRRTHLLLFLPLVGAGLAGCQERELPTAVDSGGLPHFTAHASGGMFAYVANANSDNVSVIDTETNTVVTTVPVGSGPFSGPFGVAITPDGTHAYITNEGSQTVSVIHTGSNTVVATVPVGSGARGVAITPDGTHAYVTNTFSDNVSVIHTGTNTVAATVPVGSAPQAVAITPDGTHAYVVNVGSNSVSLLDIGTHTIVATVPVGSTPVGVAVTPDGTHAYVTNAGSNNVSLINTATHTVVATVPVGISPHGVAITPDGTHAYVTSSVPDNVSVINTGTATVVATVPVGDAPLGVAITPDGTHAYVTNTFSDNISVIHTGSNTLVATVPAGDRPIGVAIAFHSQAAPPDVTAPGISLTTPADGAAYLLNQLVLADYACQDEADGSGLASCTGTVDSGEPIHTTTVGTHTFTVDASDNAGNTSSSSVSYSVAYDFPGFSAPVSNGGVPNLARAGQTIPLKWRLLDAEGMPVLTLNSAAVTTVDTPCEGGASGEPVSEDATGKSGLQNLGDGYYQFNWATPKSYANSCKRMQLDLGEAIPRTALFKFSR